jgi:hypothetical protein
LFLLWLFFIENLFIDFVPGVGRFAPAQQPPRSPDSIVKRSPPPPSVRSCSRSTLRQPPPPARSPPSAAMFPDLLAALSEGQRAIAHLVVLLAVPVVVGLVLLVRRLRRPDRTPDGWRRPEER